MIRIIRKVLTLGIFFLPGASFLPPGHFASAADLSGVTPPSAPTPTPTLTPTEDPNTPPSRTYHAGMPPDVYEPLPTPTSSPDPEPSYARRGRRRRSSGGSGSSVHTDASWLNFRFAGLGVYQGSASVYSLIGSWNPQMTFRGGQYLGLNLGGTTLTNALGQNMPVLEYQVMFGFPIGGPVGLEFGLGLQSWLKNGETDPLLSGTVYVKIPSFVDRVFVGYSAYLMNDFYTSEVKFGLGFSF